jgi:hypothetical protein
MKQREKAVYTRRISMRLKETEYRAFEEQFKKSTCRKFSEYLRNIMLAKPVTIRYRNASADAFLTEMIGLKKELSAIGNNFNQMIKRLHTISDFHELKTWLLFNESSKQILLHKVEEILKKVSQIYEQWSQE